MLSFNDQIDNQKQLEQEINKLEKLLHQQDFKNLKEAEQILFCQTRKQLGDCCYQLALCLYNQKNFDKAAFFLVEACQLISLDKLHWPYNNEGLAYYLLEGDKGHTLIQNHLGYMYKNGKGVPKDSKEAFKWFHLAAQQDYAFAQYNLGIMYDIGEGVAIDLKDAFKWYDLAAKQGHASAQNSLASMYNNGEGVSKDSKEAFKWYRLAAEQGNTFAQFNLAFMYHSGKDISKDLKEAVKWYRLAAEQGDDCAQHNLGYMYRKGEGVSKDLKEAMKWHRLAAEQNHTLAQTYFTNNRIESPLHQYHHHMLNNQDTKQICELLLEHEEVWDLLFEDLKRATNPSPLYTCLENIRECFLNMTTSLKTWQDEKRSLFHLHWFNDYNNCIIDAPDNEKTRINEKKFASFNAINFLYIKNPKEMNQLIDILAHDFLSFNGDPEERKIIEKQLCKTYQELIGFAILQKLTINWAPAAMIMIQAILDKEEIANPNVNNLTLKHMMILNDLWRQADFGKIFTAKEINEHIGISVVNDTGYSPKLFTSNDKSIKLQKSEENIEANRKVFK